MNLFAYSCKLISTEGLISDIFYLGKINEKILTWQKELNQYNTINMAI